ncbi:MAG: hypothetical protein JKY09_05800 [Crocinitomicaceae bacterium]|nr:hypothetical protein [Crocinitomicaceae bacterium]
MKNSILVVALLVSGGLFAQVGINAGGSLLKGFGQPKPWGGIHIGVEIPRDDAISIFGRVTHHLKQNNKDSLFTSAVARDITTTPYTIPVSGISSMNYTILEGGTRYYLGNGYDYGWAAYGGTNLMLIFNGVKTKYSPYDEALYELQDGADRKGAIVSFAFGIGGGVKYTMTGVGTIYFDTNISYIVFGTASNAMASQQFAESGLFSQLLFNFNLGFRKDLLW